MKPEETCCCGEPLHYTNPFMRDCMTEQVAKLGPMIDVSLGARTWKVPRHYIALHGLMAYQLPKLAAQFGWEEVTR